MRAADRFDRLCSALLGVYEDQRERDINESNVAQAFIHLADDASVELDDDTASRSLVMASIWDPSAVRVYQSGGLMN